jgi:multidrug efflux system outer membrane protein
MKIIYIMTLLILIVGCSRYTPIQVAPIEIPDHFKESINVNNSNLKSDGWKNFNDEHLNSLIEIALQNNLNYQMTLNEIEIAKAKEKSIFAELLAFDSKSDPAIQVEILEAKSRMVKLTLVSAVADVYFKIATVNANIANVSKQHDIASSLLKITKTQYDIGYIDSAALRNVKIKETSVKNDIKSLKKQQKIYMNSLADLLGQYPEDTNIQIAPLPYETEFQNFLPKSSPEQVLSDRPDIQVAFLQVAANKTPYDQAMINYKATVLNAFQEVDNALLAFKEDQEALLSEKNILKDVTNDYKSAEIQYNTGQIDYATLLSFELRLLQSEYKLIMKNSLVYADIIQIYKVLGTTNPHLKP